MTDPAELDRLDRDALFHPFTSIEAHLESGPLVMSEAEGVCVRDTRGRTYLDAMAGLWCVNVGYGRTSIAEAMRDQALRLPFFHAFAGIGNEPAARLADRLKRLAPVPMARVFFGLSGSDANDTLVKLVWHYNNLRGRPEKKKILSRKRAYHGSTIAAASLTGLTQLHREFDLPIDRVLHLETPHYPGRADRDSSESAFTDSLIADLEETIEREGPETIGAFIAEPVMGAGGVLLPPADYFPRVQAVLRAHDILAIGDEVICGFGRLGHWFGCQAYGFEPDLMTLAKGLTSGYAPLSACLISEGVWEVFRRESKRVGAFAHGFTYSAHPVCAAAAMANLDILESEDLVSAAARRGALLQRELREKFVHHPLIGDVRGTGLIAAIEPMADRDAATPFDAALEVPARIAEAARDRGLLVRPVGGAIAMSPPLVVSDADISNITSTLAEAVDAVADELERSGAM